MDTKFLTDLQSFFFFLFYSHQFIILNQNNYLLELRCILLLIKLCWRKNMMASWSILFVL